MTETDAPDALNAALDHFAALTRIFDEATQKAKRLSDRDMIERLAKAKAATDRGAELVGELRRIPGNRSLAWELTISQLMAGMGRGLP